MFSVNEVNDRRVPWQQKRPVASREALMATLTVDQVRGVVLPLFTQQLLNISPSLLDV